MSWSRLASGSSVNDRIQLGVIGTGVRGKYLIGNLPENVRVKAICDCAQSRIASVLNPTGQFKQVLARFGEIDARHCATYTDYRQLIQQENIDAVIIATPDHHHALAALHAMQKGLDVYLEKPLAVTIDEGKQLVEAVKKTGCVLQVGSQQRTMELNRFACEFVRDGGLGRISRVELPNYPGPISNWKYEPEIAPHDLDWDLFLGPTPKISYHQQLWIKDDFLVGDLLWRGWDLFRSYSGHLMTNWGAHSVDMVQYALGMDRSGPVSISPIEWNRNELEQDFRNNRWHEKTPYPNGGWEHETRFHPVSLKYHGDITLQLRPGVKTATFYGEKGRMEITRNRYAIDHPELIPSPPDPKLADQWKGSGHVARPHLENWLNCMRSRGNPNASIEMGHRTATVCHLVNIARELRRTLHWDPRQEVFVGAPEANQLLTRPRRPPFELPTF